MLVKSDEKPFNISCDFQDWTLDDPNPGRREFFATVMDAMENNESGFATFSVGVPMEEGVGGYFTNVLNLDQINLPRIAVPDITNKTIKFVDETVSPDFMKEHPDYEPLKAEKAFAIFVHEACHFLHFSRDQGEFTSPLMKGKSYTMDQLIHSPKVRREAEFEAGYRSVYYNAIHRLYPEGDRTILETNITNMMNYDKQNQSREWWDKYREIIKPWMKDLRDEQGHLVFDNHGKVVKSGEVENLDAYRAFMDGLIAKVEKFTEWADPKHEIKGVLDHELAPVAETPVDDELEKAIALIHARGLNVTKDDGTSVDATPKDNNAQSQTSVDPQLMQQMQQTAKNLGQSINNAQASGTDLENSPDFWKNFNDLNDQLDASGLCDDGSDDDDDSNIGSEYDFGSLSPAPVGDLNCVVEIIKYADTKQVIGKVNVTLTQTEFVNLLNGDKYSKQDEEAVSDRMFCNTLTDAVETQLNVQYDDYDFGDTVATDQNGNKYTIKNPWF